MHPILFVFGPVTIYSFGFMLAVAVLVCSHFMSRDGLKIGIAKDVVADFAFWTALSGVIGARLFYIFLNFDYFVDDPAEIFKLQHGGLALQGGLLFAFVTAVFYLKKKRLSVLKFLDLASPYGALGQSIGRIGCFLNGCCYGKSLSWGIYFPVHDARLHPTQIYESVGLFLIFLFLRSLNKLGLAEGRVFVSYLMGAAALRFTVQFFRDDHDPVWAGLSVYQWVSIGVFMLAFAFFVYLKNKKKSS